MHPTTRLTGVAERTSGMGRLGQVAPPGPPLTEGAASRTVRGATAAPLLLAGLFAAAVVLAGVGGTSGGTVRVATATVLMVGGAVAASGLRRDVRVLVASHQRALDEGRLLRERGDRAERACRSRDELLRALGHDLRAPLNSILGWTALLRRCPDDPATVRRATETIDRSARAQARMVDELEAVPRAPVPTAAEAQPRPTSAAAQDGSPRFSRPTLDARGPRRPS